MTQIQSDKTQIEQIIGKYIEGINQSNAEALLPLFAVDGVLMAAEAPTMKGVEQLGAFFAHGFTMIKLDANIYLDEIAVSESYAFARTHSQVKITALRTNDVQQDENRELFIFKKDNGEWKIAQYMFNKAPKAA